jgi:hypothetical protein
LDWAKSNPAEVIDRAGTTRMQYVRGLIRPTGSFVEGLEAGPEPTPLQPLFDFFTKLDEEGNTREVTEELRPPIRFGASRYFVADVPEGYDAYMAVKRVCDLSEEELESVRVVKGAHGFELQLPGEPVKTDVISFICDDDGLVTWHPGPFAAHSSLEETAVKFQR